MRRSPPPRPYLDDPPTEYYELFLDSDLNYSSGYFSDSTMSLEDAQRAKNRAILEHCRIEPSMRLLDVGCGWGATARLAAAEYGAKVIGITTSRQQYSYAVQQQQAVGNGHPVEFLRCRWEDFSEPVDRIVSINSFENFTNKHRFLSHCRRLLPTSGVMVMLTVTAERPLFRVMSKAAIVQDAVAAGFDVEISDSFAGQYAQTLERFVQNLRTAQAEVVKVITQSHLERAINYYSRTAQFLRSELNDMFEFRFVARAGPGSS